MRAPIAKIRISAGNPGWYDPLTNIHLTITRPYAFVYEGQNTSNIKRAVAHKLVCVIEGELDVVAKEQPVAEPVREVIKKSTKTEKKVEEVKTEEVKVEEVKVEEDAPVVEEKPKKTTKKRTKKTEITE